VAAGVLRRHGGASEQELAGLIGPVRGPAHLIPELRGHLPFIQKARPGSLQQESRLHCQHLAGGLVDVEQHPGSGLLGGRHRLAAGLGAFDHHSPGGSQQLPQLGIRDPGAVGRHAGSPMRETPAV